MNVLMISPGYPAETALFTQGLAAVGASVIGVGDQPTAGLPPVAREALVHYERVSSLADEAAVAATVGELAQRMRIERVECLWEPHMILASRLRELLGLPGLTVAQTVPFRDKERMKQVLDAAGLPTPKHESAAAVSGVWSAAERIGFPLVVKPVDGSGSADTFRVETPGELDEVLPRLRYVPRVSVEEFVEAEEFTYDTICAGGRVLFENICWHKPRPLLTMQHEWISPITLAVRDLDDPHLQRGRILGRTVLRTLGFDDGFTHMEWYRKADGDVVFGGIGARPPGGRIVELMNYATEADLFSVWADAVTNGRIAQPIGRRFNAASIFKRAVGAGRITAHAGLDGLMTRYREQVAALDLLPVGAPRRDWRAALRSDGMVVVRHHDLGTTVEIAERFARDLHLSAD